MSLSAEEKRKKLYELLVGTEKETEEVPDTNSQILEALKAQQEAQLQFQKQLVELLGKTQAPEAAAPETPTKATAPETGAGDTSAPTGELSAEDQRVAALENRLLQMEKERKEEQKRAEQMATQHKAANMEREVKDWAKKSYELDDNASNLLYLSLRDKLDAEKGVIKLTGADGTVKEMPLDDDAAQTLLDDPHVMVLLQSRASQDMTRASDSRIRVDALAPTDPLAGVTDEMIDDLAASITGDMDLFS